MKEPIRILNLFTIMNRGGAETMVMNYYRNIDRTKIQFDFMVHREEKGAYDDEIRALGGRIYKMPPIRPWTSFEYRKEVKKFYQEHPEYKIIHSHMSELGYYDFIEAKRNKVPVRICHAHNRPYGIDLKSSVRWYYKTKMLPYITHRFMCGEESGEWLFGKKYKDSFIQLNNAIDAKAYSYNPEIRERIRSQLNIKQNQLVVGHVGRFNLQKNHKFIIEIFNELKKQRPDVILMLVGDDKGDEGRIIHNQVNQLGIQDSVKFLGVRSNVNELMQAMDIFLFPSLFEGLSVASIEAQAAGLPVLISDKVPIECKKTNLVEVCSFSQPIEKWINKILECEPNKRRNTYEEIRKAGFDIKENAKWLEKFYIDCYKVGDK